MNDKTLLALWSMTLIALLEAVAMIFLEIDGVTLAAVVGVLAGLGGLASGFKLAGRDAGQ